MDLVLENEKPESWKLKILQEKLCQPDDSSLELFGAGLFLYEGILAASDSFLGRVDGGGGKDLSGENIFI